MSRPVIENRRILGNRARVAHVVFSLVAAIGVVQLGALWLESAWTGQDRVLTIAVIGAVLAAVCVWLGRWLSLWRMVQPVHRVPSLPRRVAAVTTFVASHEPLEMLEQTLTAMRDMREPHDTWVLDEQDAPAVRDLCARLGVRHFTRAHAPQYQQPSGTFKAATKYGNYNAWCDAVGYAEYDVLVMFDPDHVPDAAYLHRTLGYFDDPGVGFVQPPQVYYNQPASFIARGAAEESYAYYSTHLMASYSLGHTVVIGSHGLHRMEALRAIGGLPAHDAEDLYLTILYRARGWRGVFVPEILAMGLTPVDWPGYLKQQLRWSRSLLDIKLRVLPTLAGGLSTRERFLNLLHGVFYLRPLLIPVAYLVLVGLLVTNTAPAFLTARSMAVLALLFLLLGTLDGFRQRYYLDPRHERGYHWRASAMQLAKWPVFARAVVEVIIGHEMPYLLTAKTARRIQPVVAPVQLGVAVLLAVAWALGSQVHGTLHHELTLLAGLVIACTIAIGITDTFAHAPPFDPALYPARRAAMARARPRRTSDTD